MRASKSADLFCSSNSDIPQHLQHWFTAIAGYASQRLDLISKVDVTLLTGRHLFVVALPVRVGRFHAHPLMTSALR
jgi:hypothetical protein